MRKLHTSNRQSVHPHVSSFKEVDTFLEHFVIDVCSKFRRTNLFSLRICIGATQKETKHGGPTIKMEGPRGGSRPNVA
jgi:hypothetical protein